MKKGSRVKNELIGKLGLCKNIKRGRGIEERLNFTVLPMVNLFQDKENWEKAQIFFYYFMEGNTTLQGIGTKNIHINDMKSNK